MASFREFLSMPMGAGPMARPIGMDELGNVVNRPVLGPDYRVVQQPPNRQSVTRGFLGALMDDPAGTIGNALSGAAQGAWDAFSAPGRAASGETVTMGDVADVAGMVSLPALAGKYDPAVANMGIRAYHGSPHDFDRFSMDKIGTGEGAQAYGHGLYFAEAEDVARQYKNAAPFVNLTMKGTTFRDMSAGDKIIARTVNRLGIAGAKKWFKEQGGSADLLARMNKLNLKDGDVVMPKGHMYEVDINADPADFLDWDAPLSEQKAGEMLDGIYPTGLPGRDVYRMIEGDAHTTAIARGDNANTTLPSVQRKAMEDLRSLGIPGIKYRDAGSRGIDGAEGVSRNYVVFDDSLIDIIRKYGLAGAMLGFGYPQENQQ